jgi:F0F1-type ATP synthase alpha subunit
MAEFIRTIQPMIAQVKTTRRRREALAESAAKLDYMVDDFLRRGKKTEAMVTQKQLISTMELIETYDGSLMRQVSAAEKLDDVRVKLEGRLAIAKQEREELAFLLQLAKAKEMSTKAMRSLDSLMGQGDLEVARAAENIRQRLDHADAAWEVQSSSLDNQLDDAMQSLEVEAELARRMERLGI